MPTSWSRAPSATNSCAVASPIPDSPPVINTTLSPSRAMGTFPTTSRVGLERGEAAHVAGRAHRVHLAPGVLEVSVEEVGRDALDDPELRLLGRVRREVRRSYQSQQELGPGREVEERIGEYRPVGGVGGPLAGEQRR